MFEKLFENYYIVQYSIENNKINVHQLHPLKFFKNANGSTYWRIAVGSKYGVHIRKNATHWALYDATIPSESRQVYSKIMTPKTNTKFQLEADGNQYWLTMRVMNSFFKFTISEYRSLKDFNKAMNVNNF